jgi:hypothetical protein
LPKRGTEGPDNVSNGILLYSLLHRSPYELMVQSPNFVPAKRIIVKQNLARRLNGYLVKTDLVFEQCLPTTPQGPEDQAIARV